MKFSAELLALGLLGIATLPALALAASGVHQHGIAKLELSVDGSQLALRFQSPLESLVGFEMAPRTQRQHQELRNLVEQLHKPQVLFVATAGADCTPAAVTLASDVVAPELLLPGASATAVTNESARRQEPVRKGGSAVKGGPTGPRGVATHHGELIASILFRCGKPQALTGLQVRIFDAFARIRQVDVSIVTRKGQSGARLSPNRTGLTW